MNTSVKIITCCNSIHDKKQCVHWATLSTWGVHKDIAQWRKSKIKDQRLEQDSNLLESWVAQQADFIHTDMVIGTCQRPLLSPPVSSFLCITPHSPQYLTYALHLWNTSQYMRWIKWQNEQLRQNMLLQFHSMPEWVLNFVLTQISWWFLLP